MTQTIPDLSVLFEAFRRNARVNAFVLDALTDDDLKRSDGQGGMTVAQMLSHMGASRGGWLQEMSPAHAVPVTELVGGHNLWRWHTADRGAIRAMWEAGDAAAMQAVRAHVEGRQNFADPQDVGTFPGSPALFLVYMMVHDANHRGQIVALLRQGGAPADRLDHLEDQWNLWRV